MVNKTLVAIRLLPNPTLNKKPCVHIPPGNNSQHLTLYDETELKSPIKLSFDMAFDERETNQSMYQKVKPILMERIWEGPMCSVVCFGGRKSGKSYCLYGTRGKETSKSRGLVQSLGIDIFEGLKAKQSLEKETVKVFLSMVEIYKEKPIDLFQKKKQNLEVRLHADDYTFVEGAATIRVKDSDSMSVLISEGLKKAHRNSSGGSLSHVVADIILVTQLEKKVTGSYWKDSETITKRSIIRICDFASTKETQHGFSQSTDVDISIQKGVASFRKCVNALKLGHTVIPSRESQITYLMRDSFSKALPSLIIGLVRPESEFYHNNLTTLSYANNFILARKVSNSPKKARNSLRMSINPSSPSKSIGSPNSPRNGFLKSPGSPRNGFLKSPGSPRMFKSSTHSSPISPKGLSRRHQENQVSSPKQLILMDKLKQENMELRMAIDNLQRELTRERNEKKQMQMEFKALVKKYS